MAALVMKDWQVLVKGNAPVLILGFVVIGANSQGAGGWEFVGAKQDEKKHIFGYRSQVLLKWLLFLLPAILVMLGFYLKFGELPGFMS
jgi:hypothetical protein